MYEIDILNDFTRSPGARYRNDGPHSGEEFRDDHLIPALEKHGKVAIKIDGVWGYGSSFLEECFGGLIRLNKFDADSLKEKLTITHDDIAFKKYENDIWRYIDDAQENCGK